MRALGSLLLILAQLRPALGLVLCAVAGPAAPAAGEGCAEEHPVPVHAAWTEAGTEAGTGCGLTDLCSPVPQGPLALTAPAAVTSPSTQMPVVALHRAPCSDLSAPPTPPPNL